MKNINCNDPNKCSFPTDDFAESFSVSLIALFVIALVNSVLSAVALYMKASYRRKRNVINNNHNNNNWKGGINRDSKEGDNE